MGETIGSRVKRLRTKSDLSTESLGLLAGMSRSYVGNLERDEIFNPSGKALLQIANILGTNVEFLVSGIGSEPEEAKVRASVAKAGG